MQSVEHAHRVRVEHAHRVEHAYRVEHAHRKGNNATYKTNNIHIRAILQQFVHCVEHAHGVPT